MQVNWLRLFCVFSAGIFLISVVAYVWVEWSISTHTTKNTMSGISEHADAPRIPKTWSRTAFTAKETRVQQKSGDIGEKWSFEQGLTDSFDEQGLAQSEFQEDSSQPEEQMESGHESSEADETKPSEREIRIAEIKKRIGWLREQIEQLEEEEAALPPRYPPGQEPTSQTPEEMERDRKIDTRRRELRLQSAELGKEEFYLSRELKALQKER